MTIAFSDFEHGKANVNGKQLHFRLAGSGDTVILLHGWPQHSLQWHTVAPMLAEKYRVIAPDLPGCGAPQYRERASTSAPWRSTSKR